MVFKTLHGRNFKITLKVIIMQKRETTINGRQYQLMLPSVRTRMPLCTRTMALIGPALGALGGQEKTLTSFISSFQGFDPDKVDRLMMDAVRASSLSFDGKPICDDLHFEQHFSQCPKDVYQVCAWALWECVRDFLPDWADLTNLIKIGKEKMASESRKAGQTITG